MPAKILPTVGHHFSDILICKQKAWLHYHGNSREKMKPPVYLRVMQAEGQRLEAQIYESRYAGAYTAPGFGTKSDIRLKKTQEAMQRGEPIILQGYVETSLGNGTIDVMEMVGPDLNSEVGYAYRVGEIKRSEKLMTAHIMQVSWYTELLEQAYGQKVVEGFFLLGVRNNQIHVENLESYALDYQAVKVALFELRDTNDAPGAHLIPACASCDWRGVCMPRLIQENHLSLLPVLTPHLVSALKSNGFTRWQDVGVVGDEVLIEIGMTPFTVELIRKGWENLRTELAPMRNQFRKNLFDGAVAVSLDFQDLAISHKDESVWRPNAIYWYEGDELRKVEVSYDMNGIIHAEIEELLSKSMLVFYGGTDIGAFANILKQNAVSQPPALFDLFNFIEQNVHVPVPGLELRFLIQHILKKETDQTGEKRAWAIMQVLRWVSASL